MSDALFPTVESFIGATLPCGAEVIGAVGLYGGKEKASVTFDKRPINTEGRTTDRTARAYFDTGKHNGKHNGKRNGFSDNLPDLTPAKPDIDARIADLEAQVAALKAEREHEKVPAELRAGRQWMADRCERRGTYGGRAGAKKYLDGYYDRASSVQAFIGGIEWARGQKGEVK